MWSVSGQRAYHIGGEKRHVHTRRPSREILTNWSEDSRVSGDTCTNTHSAVCPSLAFIILFLKGDSFRKEPTLPHTNSTFRMERLCHSYTVVLAWNVLPPMWLMGVSPQQCHRQSVNSRLRPGLPHSLATWPWLSHLTFPHLCGRD